jgi:hypothetical protein
MTKQTEVVRKFLMSKSFFENGYEYQFVKFESDGHFGYNIDVNVILPKKGQSYATPIFSVDVQNIIENVCSYLGTSFSYSEKLFVDGSEAVKKGIFISEEKQREIISTIRKELKKIVLRTALGTLSCDVYWKPYKKFYDLNDVYIDFNFDLELSHFKIDGNYVEPNLRIADEVSGTLTNLMYDDDSFREECNNVIYSVMENEIDISSIDDLYYQVRFVIFKLDGFDVSGSGWGNSYDLEPDMFT